jgi:hypothetical protein
MAKTKVPIIKPALGVTQMPDGDLLARLNLIHDGMLNNAAFPNPPVDMAGFKAAIDAYTADFSVATLNGGKPAIVARDKARTDCIIMMRLLGHYVEAASKNDLKTFTSSGFVPAPSRQAVPPQPVDVPTIAKVEQGDNTGQLVVTINPVKKARSYELRYAAAPAAGATANWITVVIASTKPPAVVANLTRGTDYTFQVRAFGKLGFSAWSSSVDQMAT